MIRITKLDIVSVRPRMQILSVSTSEGVTGWSEATLEGRLRTLRAAIHELSDYLVGQDPRRVEHHWQRMYTDAFWRGGPVLMSAISAVDVALWDIKAKLLGVPIYELLGGPVRDRVDAYCHIDGANAHDLTADARAAIAQGFTRFKMPLTPAPSVPTPSYIDIEVARLYGLREELGIQYELAIDFHGRTTPAVARTLIRELEHLRPMFVEEPCLPENIDAMAELRRHSTVPIATGERLYSKWQFRELAERQAADIYQPDLNHAGGLTEGRKIAALAEIHYASLAPHNASGPLSLAAGVQFAMSSPAFVYQEVTRGLGEDYLTSPFVLSEGAIIPPTGPGLGVEVSEAAVELGSFDGIGKLDTLTRPDGSVGAW